MKIYLYFYRWEQLYH